MFRACDERNKNRGSFTKKPVNSNLRSAFFQSAVNSNCSNWFLNDEVFVVFTECEPKHDVVISSGRRRRWQRWSRPQQPPISFDRCSRSLDVPAVSHQSLDRNLITKVVVRRECPQQQQHSAWLAAQYLSGSAPAASNSFTRLS